MGNVSTDSNASKQNRTLLNYNDKSSTIQLSVSVALVFFAWFFILPTNICSYAYVLAAEFQISDLLFVLLSNLGGLLGLIVGGVLVVSYKNIRKLLLAINSELLLINILIFAVPSQFGLFFLLLQYFMLGLYVSVATYYFLINTFGKKRYLFTGLILAAIVTLTALFAPASGGVTISSVYTMNFVLSLVVLILVFFLNVFVPEHQEPKTVLLDKPISGSFTLMCVYTFILAFSLGYLTNESEFFVAYSVTISSLLNTVPYVGAILIVFSLPKRRPHGGIITYIANAVLIVSIAFVDVFQSATAMSGIVNVLLYSAIAINQLFIFDSILELSEKSLKPSVLISIGLFVFVSGSAIGDHLGEAIIISKVTHFDRILIAFIAFGSSILPLLRIALSNVSGTSIFRINPVVADRMTPESGSNQHSEGDDLVTQEPSNIYPQIAHYDTLTNREKEVLDLLIKGYPSEVICSTLFISANTLKRHVQNIYNKLNVHNRAELFKMLHKT